MQVQNAEGQQAVAEALAEGMKAAGTSAVTQGAAGGKVVKEEGEVGLGAPPQQAALVNSMQSIETAIVFKAMQRISSLFQQEQIPASGAVLDRVLIGSAQTGGGPSFGALPCSGGSSAFVPLAMSGLPHSEARRCAVAAPSQTSPVLPQQTDGAFCGDSDVVGDAKTVRLCGASCMRYMHAHTGRAAM